MKKIISSLGRWTVLLALVLGTAALLIQKPMPGFLKALRGGDSVYPFYTSVLWCGPYLLCCWAILTGKRWAVGFVFSLSLIEFVSAAIVAIVLNAPEARSKDIFGLFLVLAYVLILPSVQEFSSSRRNQPA
jgi:hypothetical protein